MKITHMLITALLLVISQVSFADTWCEISNFEVDAYDNGGVYIHGNVGGYGRGFIVLCGINSCNDQATDRRLSLALAAQLAGRKLHGYFRNVTDCSQVKNYDTVVSLVVKNN